MNDTTESIKSRIKNKRISKLNTNERITENTSDLKLKYFKNLVSRSLIGIILILGSVIYIKYSSANLLMYKKYVLNDSWSFGKINAIYHKYLGGILPFDNIVNDKSKVVFNETLVFKNRELYFDGYKLEVGNSYMVPALKSGIIVFMGEKENYGNTIIVQGIDGVDLWYAGLEINDIKLYDYIEKGSLVGSSIKENIFLVISRDGKFLTYEEYLE